MVRIVINVTYSYSIVIKAAKCAQESEKWKDDSGVKKMQFAHRWVKGFLIRGRVSRRKITREMKLPLKTKK